MTGFIEAGGKNSSRRLAFEHVEGRAPMVMFLPGFASDMHGTKARFFDGFCREQGLAYCRFDYSGHGQSDGEFADGTIGQWIADARTVLDHVAGMPVLLMGSSMGGWLMLHLALQRPERVAGLVGIASAPDFTERLMRPALSFAERSLLESAGRFERPSDYGEPLPITRALLEEAREHQLLHEDIPIHAPCTLLHGQNDPDVPWELSVELAGRLATPHVTVELIKDGDHRLSRPSDLKRIGSAIIRLAEGGQD